MLREVALSLVWARTILFRCFLKPNRPKSSCWSQKPAETFSKIFQENIASGILKTFRGFYKRIWTPETCFALYKYVRGSIMQMLLNSNMSSSMNFGTSRKIFEVDSVLQKLTTTLVSYPGDFPISLHSQKALLWLKNKSFWEFGFWK